MEYFKLPEPLKRVFDEKLWKQHHYQSLAEKTSDAESVQQVWDQETLSENKTRPYSRGVVVASVLAVLSIAFFTIALLVRKSSPVDQCGTTPEEARARGCFFEMTLSLWVPEECYDRELEAEYLQSEGLTYYRDLEFTQVVPFEEVKLGEAYGWFVPWEHHVRHCSFGLRKFHRAVERGGKVDGYLLNYNHTMHCLDMMTDPPEKLVKTPQRDVRMYPYCGKKGGFNVDKMRRGQWTT